MSANHPTSPFPTFPVARMGLIMPVVGMAGTQKSNVSLKRSA
jgi:hypothetical protein